MGSKDIFRFQQFEVKHDKVGLKVGTDGVLLGAWADVAGAQDILDIGTGSGLIALMLAQRCAIANIHAIDIMVAASEQAIENFNASPWAENLRCFHISAQDFAEATAQRYDLIVSNPPYFSDGLLSGDKGRASARHAISLPQDELVSSVKILLRPSGRFCVILPYLEGLRFKEIAQTAGLFCNKTVGVKPDIYSSINRWLMEFSVKASRYQYSEIFLKNETGGRSTVFNSLTSEFYLNV